MAEQRLTWRRLRVAEVATESTDVRSFSLVAVDGRALAPFAPGQSLLFRLPGRDGQPILRNYSLSGDPATREHYRISVKREVKGVGSAYMHEVVAAGTVLEAAGPTGSFCLDTGSEHPVLLLAGGIGITPLLAMAYALASGGQRRVYLIHACRDGAVAPFQIELARLAARAPNLKVHRLLERASDDDRDDPQFAGEGRITRDLLRRLLPLDAYDAYLCGPKAFMQAMMDDLVSLGIPEQRIAYEFFGVGETLRPRQRAAPAPSAPASTTRAPRAAGTDHGEHPEVVFTLAGIAARWDGQQRSLLDFAEAHGLSPVFSCRNGICNTCLTEVEGEVDYIDEPLDMPPPGKALLCCSAPRGPLRVRL